MVNLADHKSFSCQINDPFIVVMIVQIRVIAQGTSIKQISILLFPVQLIISRHLATTHYSKNFTDLPICRRVKTKLDLLLSKRKNLITMYVFHIW